MEKLHSIPFLPWGSSHSFFSVIIFFRSLLHLWIIRLVLSFSQEKKYSILALIESFLCWVIGMFCRTSCSEQHNCWAFFILFSSFCLLFIFKWDWLLLHLLLSSVKFRPIFDISLRVWHGHQSVISGFDERVSPWIKSTKNWFVNVWLLLWLESLSSLITDLHRRRGESLYSLIEADWIQW